MATFSTWLAGNEAGAQDDPVAWLARQWKALEGNRPRVSSPSGIEKHLLTLAAGEPAQADQWRGYVHTAIAEATSRYKNAKAAESNTSSEQTLPGMNEATGKPVAVVSSTQWVEHPDASKYGSCETCGWARGLARTDQPGKVVMTCAAGHVFEPQKPGPTDAGPAATTSPEATAAPAAASYDPSADGSLPGTEVAPGAFDAVLGAGEAMGYVHEDGSGPVDLLALVNLKLTVVLLSLGLPTDPDEMMGLIVAAAEQQEAGSLSEQLAAGLAGAGVDANGQLPPDFAAWYGIADPEATEQ
jgi:hypothetical protein